MPLVTLVNAAFVREILRGRMAIGTRLRTEIVADPIAIVGVAADVTRSGEADRPAMYVALDQIAVAGGSLLVRTLRAPEAVQPLLLSRVHEAAPGLAPDRVQQLSATIASTRAVARFNAQLAGGFAAIALLLAAIGVYGLTGEKSPAGGASWRCGWRSARRGAPPSGVPAHPLRWRLVSD